MSASIAIRSDMNVEVKFECGCEFKATYKPGDVTEALPTKCAEHGAEVSSILKRTVSKPVFPEGTILATSTD